MRFVVDQCVPAEVARWLSTQGHQAWTAFQAGLDDAPDEALLAYAFAMGAALVTTNRDCASLARRMRSAPVVWLQVREVDALDAVQRALAWVESNRLPSGRVLRVPKVAEPTL